MALVPDQKFSTFQSGGSPTTGDIIVGLRDGINTKFNWVLPGEVDSLEGVENQVLVNGSFGTPVTGNIILSTPQDIAPTSSPTFNALTLTNALTVPNGGTGLQTLTAYTLLAGGTTTTGNMQQVSAGTAGQLLQSNGAGALPSWTTATFPAGSGTLNHMLRSDGTNWVETTSTVLTSGDAMSGLTSLTSGNLNLTGNTLSSTDTNGSINIAPNGTGNLLIGSTTSLFSLLSSYLFEQVAANSKIAYSSLAANTNDANGATLNFIKSRNTTVGSYTIVQNNDILGNIAFWGSTGTGKALLSSISSRVDGAPSGNLIPTNLVFYTSNTSGVSTLGMTLSSAQILTLANALPSGSGGTGVNNGSSTITLGGSLTTSGAFASTFTMTGITAVTFPTSGTLATTSQIPTGAALTKTDDTNVTLTLGGSPSTALVNAASLTLGWTGTLSLARGGTAANLTASNGGIFYSTASAAAILSGTATARQMLQSGASGAPAWSTTTWPATTTINRILYSSSANVIGEITTANSGVLITSSGGVPSISTTLPSGIAATNMNLTTPTLGVASATSISFGASALSQYQGVVSFTPVATFAVVGDLSVSYAAQNAYYVRIGDLFIVSYYVDFTPTYTTASGNFSFTGLPVGANASVNYFTGGAFSLGTITFPAGTTSMCCLMTGGSPRLYTAATGSGSAVTIFTNTQFVSGIRYKIQGTITYFA